MSEKITLAINGKKYTKKTGLTILEFAEKCGIKIPTLCYYSQTMPTGCCRICSVEIEGRKNLAGACHAPAEEGMVIYTHSEKVLRVRRNLIELLLAAHPENCIFCDKSSECELAKLAADLGVRVLRFAARRRFYPAEDKSKWIFRDLSKCILCLRCISVCNEVAKKKLLSLGYRGFADKIIYGLDDLLDNQACRNCDECVKACPVGALYKPKDRFKQKKISSEKQ